MSLLSTNAAQIFHFDATTVFLSWKLAEESKAGENLSIRFRRLWVLEVAPGKNFYSVCSVNSAANPTLEIKKLYS
jgi:hypothetical protein